MVSLLAKVFANCSSFFILPVPYLFGNPCVIILLLFDDSIQKTLHFVILLITNAKTAILSIYCSHKIQTRSPSDDFGSSTITQNLHYNSIILKIVHLSGNFSDRQSADVTSFGYTLAIFQRVDNSLICSIGLTTLDMLTLTV